MGPCCSTIGGPQNNMTKSDRNTVVGIMKYNAHELVARAAGLGEPSVLSLSYRDENYENDDEQC